MPFEEKEPIVPFTSEMARKHALAHTLNTMQVPTKFMLPNEEEPDSSNEVELSE